MPHAVWGLLTLLLIALPATCAGRDVARPRSDQWAYASDPASGAPAGVGPVREMPRPELVLAQQSQDSPDPTRLYGRFAGDVKTIWLRDGRRMQLLEAFAYIDPHGTIWDAPKDWVIDGASIPQFAWSLVGGPFDHTYRNASVIHDVACDRKTRRWETVHEAFYNAMRASGVDSVRARVMYAAVYYFGPRWVFKITEFVPQQDALSRAAAVPGLFDPRSALSVAREEYYVQGYGATGALEKIPTGLEKLTVTAIPEPAGMSPDDFEKLRIAIERQNLTLEEIRSFPLK